MKNNKSKLNYFCIIAGFFLTILAITAFANAATYTFDCSDKFNCSIKVIAKE